MLAEDPSLTGRDLGGTDLGNGPRPMALPAGGFQESGDKKAFMLGAPNRLSVDGGPSVCGSSVEGEQPP